MSHFGLNGGLHELAVSAVLPLLCRWHGFSKSSRSSKIWILTDRISPRMQSRKVPCQTNAETKKNVKHNKINNLKVAGSLLVLAGLSLSRLSPHAIWIRDISRSWGFECFWSAEKYPSTAVKVPLATRQRNRRNRPSKGRVEHPTS